MAKSMYVRSVSVMLTGLLSAVLTVGCGDGTSEDTSGSAGSSEVVFGTGKTGPNAIPLDPATGSGKPKPQNVPPDPLPAFTDVAPLMGIEFRYFEDRVPGRFLLPEVMGGGVAWLDVDLDGWLDLYFANGAVLDPRAEPVEVPGNRLFRNRVGQRFEDRSEVAGADDGGYGQGVIVGDYDADGFPDVFVANYGNDVLYLNNGDGSFRDVTAVAGIGDPHWSTSGVWLDLNDDGMLDLYCANYMNVTLQNNQVCFYGDKPGYCGPGKYDGVRDAVWLNAGDGTFRDGADESGLSAPASKGLAITAIDLDRDLKPEIYVANDMEANLLFTRSASSGGSAGWREIGQQSGSAVSADGVNEASMGIAAADYDGDGLPDLYLTHYYQMKNTLYRNLGGLLFEDDSLRTGVASSSFAFLGFGVIPLDYNRDGRPDIFVANGHVLGPAIEPNNMPPQLLLNTGTGFRDISEHAGAYFLDAWIGRGVAGGDFDNDGDTDIGVSHLDRPVVLLRNETAVKAGYLGLELLHPERRSLTGTRVKVTDSRGSSEQTLAAGGSYLSTNDGRLLFGVIGEQVQVDIEWADGRVESHTDVATNQYVLVRPGQQPEVRVR